ncbi:MAG TPA: hypothetical protein VFW12_10940 [Candidatus Limnocylindria bacterium]|nr:hypothetical protein [Candidatus Limnocylindria bacterium]
MRNDLTTIGEIPMTDGRGLQVQVGGDPRHPLTIGWSRGAGEPACAISFTPAEFEAFLTLLDSAGTRLSMDALELEFERSAGTGRAPRQDEWAHYGRSHFRGPGSAAA